jgi:arsenate reductase (thioredoxin)
LSQPRRAAGRLFPASPDAIASPDLGVFVDPIERRSILGEKKRILFLCTHNSARSQMAEGLLRHLAGDRFEAMSAGTEATRVRPLAVRAMDEIGVDISGQESKRLERYLKEPFEYVITVCDDANEACPFFPGAQSRLHWSFEDPSRAEGSEEERLAVFRSVRDRIRERIEEDLFGTGGRGLPTPWERDAG